MEQLDALALGWYEYMKTKNVRLVACAAKDFQTTLEMASSGENNIHFMGSSDVWHCVM